MQGFDHKEKIKELKEKIKSLETEKQDLQAIIQTLESDVKEKDDQLTELKRKYNNAKNLIRDQLKEIENLKKNAENKNEKKNDFALNFQSPNFSFAIICSEEDIFAYAEEKLYRKFEELRDNNNIFLYNGKQIKRFRTIKENKIESGVPIIMHQLDDFDEEKTYILYKTKLMEKKKSNDNIENNDIKIKETSVKSGAQESKKEEKIDVKKEEEKKDEKKKSKKEDKKEDKKIVKKGEKNNSVHENNNNKSKRNIKNQKK